jgi:hypothetical protein
MPGSAGWRTPLAEELLVDRAGEGDGVDRHASDLLRLRFLEVTGNLM